ncbi:hypothetical protein DSECCO2_519720 [anaerobic digester metagenome]
MIELYLIAPSILLLIVIVSSLLDRWSVPVILIALEREFCLAAMCSDYGTLATLR